MGHQPAHHCHTLPPHFHHACAVLCSSSYSPCSSPSSHVVVVDAGDGHLSEHSEREVRPGLHLHLPHHSVTRTSVVVMLSRRFSMSLLMLSRLVRALS